MILEYAYLESEVRDRERMRLLLQYKAVKIPGLFDIINGQIQYPELLKKMPILQLFHQYQEINAILRILKKLLREARNEPGE